MTAPGKLLPSMPSVRGAQPQLAVLLYHKETAVTDIPYTAVVTHALPWVAILLAG